MARRSRRSRSRSVKVVEGEKHFRVIPLPEWRGKLDDDHDALAPFLGGPFPSLKEPVDAFDDAYVDAKWVKERNATVYAGTLRAGDWIYIPVGAFHGAKGLASCFPLQDEIISSRPWLTLAAFPHTAILMPGYCLFDKLPVGSSRSQEAYFDICIADRRYFDIRQLLMYTTHRPAHSPAWP